MNTDRTQLAALDKAPRRGRPLKGQEARSERLTLRLSPTTLERIGAAAQDGESPADVITRWAEEAAVRACRGVR